MFELFAWLMITLMAGFGGIIIGSALKESKTKSLVGEYQGKG